AESMEIRITVRLYVRSTGYTGIAHNGGTASRFEMSICAFIPNGKGMVGTKLVSHFVCHKVYIEVIPFWYGMRGETAAFTVVHTYTTDTPCFSVVAPLNKHRADIIIFFTDNAGQGILQLAFIVPGIRVVVRIGIDYFIRIFDQHCCDGKIIFKKTV